MTYFIVIAIIIKVVFEVEEEWGGGGIIEHVTIYPINEAEWNIIHILLFLPVPVVPTLPTCCTLPAHMIASSSFLPLSWYPLHQHSKVKNMNHQRQWRSFNGRILPFPFCDCLCLRCPHCTCNNIGRLLRYVPDPDEESCRSIQVGYVPLSVFRLNREASLLSSYSHTSWHSSIELGLPET